MSPPAFAPWLSRGPLAVLGSGLALPGEPLTTERLLAIVEARFGVRRHRQADMIARRLDIASRHVARPLDRVREPARPDQSNPDLAAVAVRAALSDAGVGVGDLAYLIGHTATPLQPLPANIALVADALGYDGPHVELRQACTGFANALMIAHGLLAAPGARPVAIVGSETGSMFIDPTRAARDTGQLVNLLQMGDGAGAVVLGPAGSGAAAIGAAWFGAIGLGRSPGIQRRCGDRDFEHDFAAIRREGHRLFEMDVRAAAVQGCALADADRIIPHQASGRIGDQLADHFGLDRAKPFVHAGRLGNTGSAAMWLALADLRRGGLAAGHRVLALGAEASKYLYGGFVYEHG